MPNLLRQARPLDNPQLVPQCAGCSSAMRVLAVEPHVVYPEVMDVRHFVCDMCGSDFVETVPRYWFGVIDPPKGLDD